MRLPGSLNPSPRVIDERPNTIGECVPRGACRPNHPFCLEAAQPPADRREQFSRRDRNRRAGEDLGPVALALLLERASMKLTTAALASVLALSCAFAFAQGGGGGTQPEDQPVVRPAPAARQVLQAVRREQVRHRPQRACKAPRERMVEEE